MHIYFSGIGGAGIGPLSQVAHDAGYKVSGSDKQNSSYIGYLKKHGIDNIHIGQDRESIEKVHEKDPIDWFVYSSALTLENPNAPELAFCKENDIKVSKRDELLNEILKEKQLKLVAIAGTHGKTTTTAMLTYLLTSLDLPISYLLPAKTSFAEMGNYNPKSSYFIYEADEFDHNFLAFEPEISLISGVSWDHYEIFKTREDYQEAFKDFIGQSSKTYIWQEDYDYLGLDTEDNAIEVLNSADPEIEKIELDGQYNRLDAYLTIKAVHDVTNKPIDELIRIVNSFPGLSRRMEQIVPNLYTDYAHTPEKIKGAMSVALEMAKREGQKLVVVYEPLTDRRQHYIIDQYKDCFNGVEKLYWLPSYLAREDPEQDILPPSELIKHLSNPAIAEPSEKNEDLKHIIKDLISQNYMVVCMAGGGGGSLDDWLREQFI
jgi:UDP-N-acetylmuramate--alanine ligase